MTFNKASYFSLSCYYLLSKEYIIIAANIKQGPTSCLLLLIIVAYFFRVVCFLRISETSSSLPWKSETLADCFGDNIGNRVSAKMLAQWNVNFPISFYLVVLDLIRWGFGGFLLGLAGAGNRIGLEQLNFVMVSSSFALPCFAGASIWEKSGGWGVK